MKVVSGHNSFQDGENFLKNSGEKGPQIQMLPPGPQFDVLKPGTYYINPLLFKAEQTRIAMEKTRSEADQQKNLVEAEGSKILAIGEATAKAYELQNKAIGQQGVTAIEIAKQIASGNVKVTPDLLVQGGDNLGGLLSTYFTKLIAAPPPQDAPSAKQKAQDPLKELTKS